MTQANLVEGSELFTTNLSNVHDMLYKLRESEIKRKKQRQRDNEREEPFHNL